MRRYWMALAIVGGAVLAGCAADKLMKQGDAMLAGDRAIEAVGYYEQAQVEKPKLATDAGFSAKLARARCLAAYQRGASLGGQGEWERAVTAFQESLQLGAEAADAPRALAEAKREASTIRHRRALERADEGKLNEAILELRRALELNPENLDAKDALESVEGRKRDELSRAESLYGEALAQQGERRWLAAGETLRKAIVANANHLPARIRLHTGEARLAEARKARAEGQRLSGEKRLDAAIASYESALGVWPFFEDARRELGETRRRREVAQGHLNRAKELAAKGEWDEAAQASHAALGTYPHFQEAQALLTRSKQEAAAAHLGTGNGLLAEGKLEEAEAAFARALGYVPDMLAAREGLALADVTRGEAAEAQSLWGNALVWYMNAADHVGRPEYRAKVSAARGAVLGRIGFGVRIEAGGGAGGGAETSQLKSLVVQGVSGKKPAFLDVADAGGAAYTARVQVTRLDIAERHVGTEQRVHAYALRQVVPNPKLPELHQKLLDARHDLARTMRAYHRRCRSCRGTGRLTCPKCGGTASLPCGPCGGTGIVAGNPCPTCHGTGKTYCNACSTDAIRNGWIICPRCKGYGNEERLKEKDVRFKRTVVERAERALRSEPTTVVVQATAQWPYTVETFEKSGALSAGLEIVDGATGRVVHTEAVQRTSRDTDQTIQNANPAIGLSDDAATLPSDAEVCDALVRSAAGELAGRVLSAVVQARVNAAQGRAQRLSAAGNDSEAVEAYVDAALLVEPLNAAEARRVLKELRGAQ